MSRYEHTIERVVADSMYLRRFVITLKCILHCYCLTQNVRISSLLGERLNGENCLSCIARRLKKTYFNLGGPVFFYFVFF